MKVGRDSLLLSYLDFPNRRSDEGEDKEDVDNITSTQVTIEVQWHDR